MTNSTMLGEALAEAAALDAPLQEQLSAFDRILCEINEPFHAGYVALIERLKAGKAGAGAPQVGDSMPAFVLPDQNGALVSLDGLLARGPVVLSFNRGHWCPFCDLELGALAKAHAALGRLGVAVVSVMPDHPRHTAKMRDRGIEFPVLFDLDNAFGLELSLAFWVDDRLDDLMRQLDLKLDEIQDNGSRFLPIPATFVIGTDGRVKARNVDADFRNRMSIDAIFECAKALAMI